MSVTAKGCRSRFAYVLRTHQGEDGFVDVDYFFRAKDARQALRKAKQQGERLPYLRREDKISLCKELESSL